MININSEKVKSRIVKSQLPLRSAIIEILRDKDGEMLDSDLLVALKARYGEKYFSNNEINNNLLSLETQGLIHVSILSKNKKRIKQVTDRDMYMGVDED